MPGGYSEAASRVLTILEQTWPATRARHPEIPPVVIIIASGTTGLGTRWDHSDPQRQTTRTTATQATILLIQASPATHLRRRHGQRRPPPFQTPPRG